MNGTAKLSDFLPPWEVREPIDADWLRRYAAASGDDNPLHIDPAIAVAAGFPGPIVPGMLLLGLCERAVRAWYEDATILRLAGRFLHPVVIPARLVVSGRVAQVADAGREVVLRMFIGTAGAAPSCMADAKLRPRVL